MREVDRTEIAEYLRSRPEILKKMELLGPAGQTDERRTCKLEEVSGFCAIILRYVREFLTKKDSPRSSK